MRLTKQETLEKLKELRKQTFDGHFQPILDTVIHVMGQNKNEADLRKQNKLVDFLLENFMM